MTDRLDTAVPCADPECVDRQGHRSLAEPEQDGEIAYWACPACGACFGYRRRPATTVGVNSAGTCAVGVDEATRRAASAAIVDELGRTAKPLLQIGRPADAAAA